MLALPATAQTGADSETQAIDAVGVPAQSESERGSTSSNHVTPKTDSNSATPSANSTAERPEPKSAGTQREPNPATKKGVGLAILINIDKTNKK
jgi:hypothetical protein